VLGLDLERDRSELRLHDRATGRRLPTVQERAAEEAQARQRAEEARQREAEARQRAEEARQREAEARQRAEEARQQIEAENERLRRELAAWQRRVSGEA
jgi:membrane protein involved in colicin uptake